MHYAVESNSSVMVCRLAHMPPYQTVMEFIFVLSSPIAEMQFEEIQTLHFKAILSIDEKKCQEFLQFVDKLYDRCEFPHSAIKMPSAR